MGQGPRVSIPYSQGNNLSSLYPVPLTFEVLQSGWWEQALALWVLGTVLSHPSGWFFPWLWGKNGMCCLHSAVPLGGPPADFWCSLSVWLPHLGILACRLYLSWRPWTSAPSPQPTASARFCSGSPPCPALHPHHPVCSCPSGTTVALSSLFSVSKITISKVLSGYVVVLGGEPPSSPCFSILSGSRELSLYFSP